MISKMNSLLEKSIFFFFQNENLFFTKIFFSYGIVTKRRGIHIFTIGYKSQERESHNFINFKK